MCEINFRYMVSSLTTHYFWMQNYGRYGAQISWKFYINSNKNKSHHCCEMLENHSGGIVDELFSETRKIILIYKAHWRCVANRNQ